MPFDAMPVRPDGILTVLQAARGMISEPQNWVKGYHRAGPARCAVSAILHAFEMHPVKRVNKHDITKRLGVGDTIAVVSYNDASTTTHAMMLEKFDSAITARVAELTAMATAEG